MMMNKHRIEELAALPLPGVVASTPDEYEWRRAAHVIRIAVNEVLDVAAKRLEELADSWGSNTPLSRDKYETYYSAADQVRDLKLP